MEKSKSGDKPSGDYDTFDSLEGPANKQNGSAKGFPGSPGGKGEDPESAVESD